MCMKKRFGRKHLVHHVRDRDVERDFPRQRKQGVPVAVWIILVLGVVLVSVVYLAGNNFVGLGPQTKSATKLSCDPNSDGTLNIADAIFVLQNLKDRRGDCDRNGVVNDKDAEWILSYLFGGSTTTQPISVGSIALAATSSCTYVHGDANQDGSFNLADAVYLLSVLFPPAGCSTSGTCPQVLCFADTDSNLNVGSSVVGDGSINLADVVSILFILFPSTGCTLNDPNGNGVWDDYPECPFFPIPVAGPNLIINSISHSLVPNASLTDATILVTVKNIGAESTQVSSFTQYDQSLQGPAGGSAGSLNLFTPILSPGQSHTITRVITGIGSGTTVSITSIADTTLVVAETNENDNQATYQFFV
jgi:hypothetical protein